MKFNYRKITAIASSILLTGMTLGVAAAASYPAPFVSGGTANVAIVYGTGEGVSSLDIIQAGNIQTNLQSKMGAAAGSTTTVTGGDSVKLEKASTKFQLGKGVTDIISTSITDDSPGSGLSTLLADGIYTDDDNEEFDYTQKIDVANLTLQMFDNDDYSDDDPTVGLEITDGTYVLNYTMDFSDTPYWTDMATTTLKIMGKEYYVLSYTNLTTLNLLDAAESTTLSEGESTTVTVDGTPYEVSINFIGSKTVKLEINGVVTNTLDASSTNTQKLSDGAYVGIKSINTQDYAGGIKTVEFSIGKGKLKLVSGSTVEINDVSISGLTNYLTSDGDGKLQKIAIKWDAKEDLFVTPTSEVLMPGFGAVKLSMAGMVYPAEESIKIKASSLYIYFDDFPLKDGPADIPFLYGTTAGAYAGVGKKSTQQLRTSNNASIRYNTITDDYFVASYNDGTNVESYLMSLEDLTGNSGVNTVDVKYYANGAWVTKKNDAKEDDTITLGSVSLAIGNVSDTHNAVTIEAGTNVNFRTLYSKEGLEVWLPYVESACQSTAINDTGAISFNSTVKDFGHNSTSWNLTMSEEDWNGNIGDGRNITAPIRWNSESTAEPEVADVLGESVTFEEILSSNVYQSFVYSALATKILWDKPSSGSKTLEIVYHGGESYGEVYVSSPDANIEGGEVIGGTTVLGDVIVKDSEVSSVSSKNLIIVGGSCINSAAATVLGGAYCGAAFTESTGVGSGQFLIKGVSGAYSSGKIALVVAGYEAADTVNAAKYLTTQVVDTSKAYKGTSSTSAELVTETA